MVQLQLLNLLTESKAKGRKKWCDDHKTRTSDDWKYIMMSHPSHYSQHQAGFIVWTSPKEAYNPECLVPTVKHGGGSVTIWAAISSILLVLYLL